MNYNMQVHIERVNGKFMAQMEVSGIGRAKRDRVSTDSLAEALEKIAAFHATTYAELEDFHRPPAPAPEPAYEAGEVLTDGGLELGQVTVSASECVALRKVDRRTKEGKRQFALAK